MKQKNVFDRNVCKRRYSVMDVRLGNRYVIVFYNDTSIKTAICMRQTQLPVRGT